MCLAVPGKIISISPPETTPRIAKADIGGLIREVCIEWLPDIKVNQYVIIHAGYALNIIDELEAQEQINAILNAEEIIKKNISK